MTSPYSSATWSAPTPARGSRSTAACRGLDGIESRVLALDFDANRASATYRPNQPGSYLARWRVGGETLYRYFAVIEDDWAVVRFSSGVELDPHPNLHATGIPLDYRLPVVRVDKSR